LKDLLLVGLGGALGAVLRFSVGWWVQKNILTFPLGTFLINVLGSFFLGFIMYAVEYGGFVDRELRVFLTIGVLGAFTTFSSLEYESLRLFEEGELSLFFLNLFGNVVLGLGAVVLGKVLAGVFFH